MKFSWEISFVDESDAAITSATRSNLTALNNEFKTYADFTTYLIITYDNFQLDLDYNVSVTVTNFLNQSHTASTTVKRVNEVIPYLTLDGVRKTAKASQPVFFKGVILIHLFLFLLLSLII